VGALEDEHGRADRVLLRALQGRRPPRTLARGEADRDAAVQAAPSGDDPRPLVGDRGVRVRAVPSGEIPDGGGERLGGLGRKRGGLAGPRGGLEEIHVAGSFPNRPYVTPRTAGPKYSF